MNNKLLEAALEYREKYNYSIIPLYYVPPKVNGKKGDKKAYVPWTMYEKELPTPEDIKQWWTKWPDALIGVVTGKVSGIVTIDVDENIGFVEIEKLIPDSLVVPTYHTPSGGVQMLFTMPNFDLRVAVRNLPGCDLRAEGGLAILPPSFHVDGKYQWLDGLSLNGNPLPSLPEPYLKRINKSTIIGTLESCSNSLDYNTNKDYNGNIILHEGSRDMDLFRIGMALADGKCKRNELIQVLEILAKNCVPPFPENELQAKIKSIYERVIRKERNLMDEVREWCLLQKGNFSTTDVRHELQITTKIEIKNLSVIINRLQVDGIIEKFGEKRGCYRTKEVVGHLDMEFIEDFIPEFDIKLPFGLNGIVALYPKNIIIVAGSKSAGKTALLLKIAKDNQDIHEVVYLNSEMGDEEWSLRLKKIGLNKKTDIRFRSLGVSRNFHDFMDQSKKIFIVDFLEIHKDFYEIAKYIRMIHEVIKDGICIIAVQKKQGELLARGAEFSMEKARLYLSLDFLEGLKCTQLTIADAKSPKVPKSIRGWSKKIKFIDYGSKMEVMDRDWVQ